VKFNFSIFGPLHPLHLATEWHAQKVQHWPPMLMVQISLMLRLTQDKKHWQQTSLLEALAPVSAHL